MEEMQISDSKETKKSSRQVLEDQKLELEIKELRGSNSKEIIRHFITVLVAALTVYLVYMNSVWDSKEAKAEGDVSLAESIYKRTEAERVLNEIILETYERSKYNDQLDEEIGTMKLILKTLNDSISNILEQKKILEEEISMAPSLNYINKFKQFPSFSDEYEALVRELTFNVGIKEKLIDTLMKLAITNDIYQLPIYSILYLGTHDNQYKSLVLQEIKEEVNDPVAYSGVHGNMFHTEFNNQVGSASSFTIDVLAWPLEVRYEIADILIDGYKSYMPSYIKYSILNLIGRYYDDDEFDLSNYNHANYLKYLVHYRTLFFETNQLDKYAILLDISKCSPHLFWAILVENSRRKETDYAYMKSPNAEIYRYILDGRIKNEEFSEFRHNNSIDITSLNGFYHVVEAENIYIRNKESIDSWLYGDLERIRHDKVEFDNYLRLNKF